MRHSLFGIVPAFASILFACGGSQPAKTVDAQPTPSASTTTTAATSAKPTSLTRSNVKRAIGQGLGVLLQNVSVEDWPVMRDGKFYGFRLRSINASWNTDLRAGDVVTRVNGMPIEHPEEADAALRSLEKAPALRIDFERDGKPRTLELPIVEDAAR